MKIKKTIKTPTTLSSKTKKALIFLSPVLTTPFIFVACGVPTHNKTSGSSTQTFSNLHSPFHDGDSSQYKEYNRNSQVTIDLNKQQEFDITQYKSMKDAIDHGLRIRDINRDLFTRFGQNEADRDYFNANLYWVQLDYPQDEQNYQNPIVWEKSTGGGIDNLLKYFAGTDLWNTPLKKLRSNPFPYDRWSNGLSLFNSLIKDSESGERSNSVSDQYIKQHPGPISTPESVLKGPIFPQTYQNQETIQKSMTDFEKKYEEWLESIKDKNPSTLVTHDENYWRYHNSNGHVYWWLSEYNDQLATVYNWNNIDYYTPLLKEIQRHTDFDTAKIFQAFNDVVVNGYSNLLPGFNLYVSHGLKLAQSQAPFQDYGDQFTSSDMTIDKQLKDIKSQLITMGYFSILNRTYGFRKDPSDPLSDWVQSQYTTPVIDAEETLALRGDTRKGEQFKVDGFTREEIAGAGKLFLEKMLAKDPKMLKKIPLLNPIKYVFINPNWEDIRYLAQLFTLFSWDIYNLNQIIRQFRKVWFVQHGKSPNAYDEVMGKDDSNYISWNPASNFLFAKTVLSNLDKRFGITDDKYVTITSGLKQRDNSDLCSNCIPNPLANEGKESTGESNLSQVPKENEKNGEDSLSGEPDKSVSESQG